MNILDIFNDDAFSCNSLTTMVNNMDHTPGRAGEVVFTKLKGDEAKGIENISVSIESQDEFLTLHSDLARGGPAPKEVPGQAHAAELQRPADQVGRRNQRERNSERGRIHGRSEPTAS